MADVVCGTLSVWKRTMKNLIRIAVLVAGLGTVSTSIGASCIFYCLQTYRACIAYGGTDLECRAEKEECMINTECNADGTN